MKHFIGASTAFLFTVFVAITANAQTQTNDTFLGSSNPAVEPKGQENLSGIVVDELHTRSDRQSAEPGKTNDTDDGNSTTLIVGPPNNVDIIRLQNVDQRSGLTINGNELSAEERARMIAAENLKRGSVIGGATQPKNINTTIHADSIIVIESRNKDGKPTASSCVRIGVVGDSPQC